MWVYLGLQKKGVAAEDMKWTCKTSIIVLLLFCLESGRSRVIPRTVDNARVIQHLVRLLSPDNSDLSESESEQEEGDDVADVSDSDDDGVAPTSSLQVSFVFYLFLVIVVLYFPASLA